jgi:hypothetical protein
VDTEIEWMRLSVTVGRVSTSFLNFASSSSRELASACGKPLATVRRPSGVQFNG